MELVNTSHLQRHCTQAESYVILSVVSMRVEQVTKTAIAKCERFDGHYFMKIKLRHFDAKKALKELNIVAENPYRTKQDVDYEHYRDVVQKVVEDRLAYGDKVPDTTDIYNETYEHKFIKEVKGPSKSYIETREKMMRYKNRRKEAFKAKWDSLNWDEILSA